MHCIQIDVTSVVNYKIFCGSERLVRHLHIEAELLRIRRNEICYLLWNVWIANVIDPESCVEIAVIGSVASVLKPWLSCHRLMKVVRTEGCGVSVSKVVEVLVREVLRNLRIRKNRDEYRIFRI